MIKGIKQRAGLHELCIPQQADCGLMTYDWNENLKDVKSAKSSESVARDSFIRQ
jgi:hypothetical protein